LQAPSIDVSTRTDQQLTHLSTNGRNGYKEAAIAEIARRAGGNVSTTTPVTAGDSVSLPPGQGKETGGSLPKPTLEERKAAALELRKAKEAATKAAEARTIAARAPEVASLADRLKAAAATAVGSRKAALEARLVRLEAAKPDAQKSAKGFEAVAQRQVNAENRFVDSVVEQFGLSRDDATSAWNYYLKNKLVKVDSVGGQYNLTDGRLWDAGALKQAAAEFGSRQSPARTKGPSVIAQKTSPIMRRDDIVGEIMRITGGGGISPTMARDITGDSANRASKLRGLFTNRGQEDLDDIATNLQLAGYDVRDGNHLSELLREASFGNVAVSMERQERDKDSEKERQHRDRIRAIAKRRGIKSVAVKFSALESQVFAMLEARTKKAVEMLDARSQARFDRALADARGLVSEDEIDSILADASRRGLKSREFWNSGANLIRGMVEDARFAKQENEDDGYQIPDTPWIEDGDGRGNTTVSGADPFGGSDQEAADPFGLEGQSAEDIAKQEADRVAAEKAKQDEESQAAKDKKDAEKQSLAEKVKARAANPDNFQFGEDSKAAAKPMGGLFDQSTQSAKLDGANGTIKRPDSLNLLANPVAYGDTIQFSDGSKWVAKNGWTGGPGAWTLLQGKTQHPTVAGINGQSEFIRAIIEADEASKPTAEGGKQNGEGGKSAVEGGKQHRYALVNRPPGLGAIPKDMQYTVEPRPPAGQAHHDMARHGILVTDRELTKAEQESFELAPIVEGKAEDALADQIASGSMSSYAERYVEKFSKNRELVVQAVMQQVERAGRYSIADRDAFVAKVVDRLKANVAKPAEKKEKVSDREAAHPWSVIKANSEWVKLGDGSHQFRYDGMGNGQVIDTHRSEGRSGANKWRTSDGELHDGLAAAKAHEIETYAKPNLRANGYLEKEAEAAPAKGAGSEGGRRGWRR
jgi:hypothetical protein